MNCSSDDVRGHNWQVVLVRVEGCDVNCVVEFPDKWIDGNHFEAALRKSGDPLTQQTHDVTFKFPVGCKIMVDSVIRLLSLVNQLAYSNRQVRLNFQEGHAGTMGYLNRMGFFDHLREEVETLPERPTYSRASLHQGSNSMLVEIACINKDERDEELLGRLTEAISHACRNRNDVNELSGATWTIFAELIDNIFAHSETQLDGYAALQVYSGGNRLSVAVSDSGLGIMKTLRPSLRTQFPQLERLSDTDLLVEVFRQGVSRHGDDRGCGLKGCSAKAIKFNARLDVRLPNQRVVLTPSRGVYELNRAYCQDDLPLICGTHIAIGFGLGA